MNNREIFLVCFKRATELIKSVKSQFPSCETAKACGSDPKAPDAGESTADMLAALKANMPDFIKLYQENILPTEQSTLDAAKATSPEYAKMQAENYGLIAPIIAGATQSADRSTRLADSATDKSILEGTGKDVVGLVDALNRGLDPEFFKAREDYGSGLSKLIDSFGTPSGELSGGERAEVERSANRDNQAAGLGTRPTALTTIDNAIKFGSAAFAKKAAQQQGLTNALSGGGSNMGQMRQGIDPFLTITGKPSSMSPSSANQFASYNGGTGSAAMNLQQGLFGEIGQNQRAGMDINSQRRDGLDRVTGVMGSISV